MEDATHCKTCNAHYYLKEDKTECKTITGCDTMSSSDACNKCLDGYTLKND